MSVWQSLSALVRMLLMMSITGSILAVLLYVLQPLWKYKIPKRVQHGLWKQAPDGGLIFIQLAEHNLLIHFHADALAVQQVFHNHLDFLITFTNQLSYQSITAAVYPISRKPLFT